ncbi:G-protein coupled receptor Mth2 isoform X1 [Camponotus floridanus]|uniref:G-protein coupled receptor Mth2 isoform X1 n=1 Tax=Camponotus floridanus TaxID=104421 RepID=UPI00059CBC7E|nr:G-protein coupled receptor Mth2 isoform X1 [Camponotus floridanus]
MSLIYICALLVCLSTSIASDESPIIHTIPLQNETVVPEEYRNLPLVGKCCPVNEVLERSANESKCVPSTLYFSPLFSEFNHTGVLVPGDESSEFVAIVGSPCDKKYMLKPEEDSKDNFYLLSNGSIFAPKIDHVPLMLMPGKDYCMEVVPGEKQKLRALVCFKEPIPPDNGPVIIYACGLLISVPFFILTIAAYVITPKLKDVYGKALCHYCGCLAVAFITLAITQLASARLSSEVCISIAFVIQFSFVACFFWLNVMCIETWSLVHHHVNHRTYRRIQPKTLFFYYSIWAWGPSTILLLILIGMNFGPMIPMTYAKPTFSSVSCFMSNVETIPYFYMPIGLLLLANMILFIITSIKIGRYQQELALRCLARNQHSDREDQRLFRRIKRTFVVCLMLFFLMGLNWIMELISWWAGPLSWSAFDLVNALQGVLVFGLFVLRKPTRDVVWHRIQKLRGIHTTETVTPNIGNVKCEAFNVRVDYVSREPEAIDKLMMTQWKKEPECIYSSVA